MNGPGIEDLELDFDSPRIPYDDGEAELKDPLVCDVHGADPSLWGQVTRELKTRLVQTVTDEV